MAYSPIVNYNEDDVAPGNPTGPTLVYVRDDAASGVAGSDGDWVAVRGDDKGGLYVKDSDAYGALSSLLLGLGFEDDPFNNLDAGFKMFAQRKDTPANNSGTDGDIEPLQMSAGRLWTSAIVTSLPSLPAGTNNIGDVDVLTVPSDPFGANADAAVAAGATGSIQAKLRRATQGLEDLKTSIVLAASTNTQEIVGDVASNVAIAANPVTIGARASAAIPSAVGADGRAVNLWANLSGAQMVSQAPHIGLNSDPWNLVHKGAQYTSTQTSTVFQAGAAGEKIVVTKIQIQAFGTTTFDLQVYFGTGAFSRGTSRTIFDGTFKPSSTLAPGVVMDGPFIAGSNGDDIMVTTSAAGSVTISIWYYVIT